MFLSINKSISVFYSGVKVSDVQAGVNFTENIWLRHRRVNPDRGFSTRYL